METQLLYAAAAAARWRHQAAARHSPTDNYD